MKNVLHSLCRGPAGLIALCLLLHQGADAATIESCRDIETPAARLACYDRIAGRGETAAMPMVQAAANDTPGTPGTLGTQPPLSPLQQAWGVEGDAPELFRIRAYRPVYILPFFASSRVNSEPSSPSLGSVAIRDLRNTEAKFQLSFKTQLANNLFGDNGDLWAGYTQSSRWQVYADGISRPFRETNYEPELMFTWKTHLNVLGWNARYVGVGFNHESNGRANPLSRSWNRVIGQAGFERDDWTATLRLWQRVGENNGNDDNPDIIEHMGRGDLLITRNFGHHRVSAMIRPAFIGGSSGHGALRLDWGFPLSGQLRGHLQWFIGKGESLIDYNQFTRSIGLGISLVEW